MVRIRVPPLGGFEHDGATTLSVKEHFALIQKFQGDYDRIGDFVRGLQNTSSQVRHVLDYSLASLSNSDLTIHLGVEVS